MERAPNHNKYEANDYDSPSLQELLQQQDITLSQLKRNLAKAQQFAKNQSEKHRKTLSFEVGDMVLIKLQPYK